MNRFFKAGDRAAWSAERAGGFWRFWYRRVWPFELGLVVVWAVERFAFRGGNTSWQELVVRLAELLAAASLGIAFVWWNRERLFRRNPVS